MVTRNRTRKLVLGIAVAVVLAASASCDDDEDTPNGGGQGGSAAATFGTSECGICVDDACAAERGSCEADPSCAGYLSCLAECPVASSGNVDAPCAAACPPAQGATGQDAQAAYDTCRTAGAGALCAACGDVPDGGAGGMGGAAACEPPAVLTQECPDVSLSNPCMECMSERCCDSVDAVMNGGPATDLQECWYACDSGDAECAAACYEAHPDGLLGFGGWQACFVTQCYPEGPCDAGNPCNTCQYANCGCELARCYTNPECFLIAKGCMPVCGPLDTACLDACIASHPDGAEDYDRFAVCSVQTCIDQCGG